MEVGSIVLVVSLLLLVSSFLWLDRSLMSSRYVGLVASLASLATLSRLPVAGLPGVQGATFIIIACGAVFGAGVGVGVGLLTAILSNMFLGQGIWTFFQMLAWGLCGASSGVLLKVPKLQTPLYLALFGGAWGFFYGWITNTWYWAAFVYPNSLGTWIAVNTTSLWFDATHAVVNVVLAVFFGESIVAIFRRYGERFA